MLNKLAKLKRPSKRIGRGGDRGGTSGKGHKGQKARSGGGVSAQFEGGQTPLTRRIPKRGFCNTLFARRYTIINLEQLSGFDKEQEITKHDFVRVGLIKSINQPVKLLANKAIAHAVVVHLDACSVAAREAVQAAGGRVVIE